MVQIKRKHQVSSSSLDKKCLIDAKSQRIAELQRGYMKAVTEITTYYIQDHTDWHWKSIAWSNECKFLLRNLDGKVRIWHKDYNLPEYLSWPHQLNWFLEHDSKLTVLKRRAQYKRAPLWCGVREDLLHASKQICSNCLMMSFQYGANSLRNVLITFLNVYHKQLNNAEDKRDPNPVLAGSNWYHVWWVYIWF